MLRWIACAALFGALACGSSLDDSLDGKACSSAGACVSGYVCSSEYICVRAGDSEDGGAPLEVHGEHD